MLPIAEHFHSIQGEGTYVGTPMHFIRLAGCTVGRKQPDSPLLKTGETAWQCASWDGRKFWCDTDFKKSFSLSVATLLDDTWEKHICLTGGEPLMHMRQLEIDGFFEAAKALRIRTHVETSGTIKFRQSLKELYNVWITVAPKEGVLDEMLEMADEIKLLISHGLEWEMIHPAVLKHPNVYVSPINNELTIDQDNVKRAMQWLRRFPQWKLSCQWHKFLGLR